MKCFNTLLCTNIQFCQLPDDTNDHSLAMNGNVMAICPPSFYDKLNYMYYVCQDVM